MTCRLTVLQEVSITKVLSLTVSHAGGSTDWGEPLPAVSAGAEPSHPPENMYKLFLHCIQGTHHDSLTGRVAKLLAAGALTVATLTLSTRLTLTKVMRANLRKQHLRTWSSALGKTCTPWYRLISLIWLCHSLPGSFIKCMNYNAKRHYKMQSPKFWLTLDTSIHGNLLYIQYSMFDQVRCYPRLHPASPHFLHF